MSAETILAEWQQRVRDAAAARRPLRPRGFGSKDFYGGELEGEILDTRGYAGIVRYEPTELVATVRCGTPLADLEAALAEKGQWLPFEPPHYGGASVGGMVAAGLAGPGRMAAGGVRDYVLGVTVIDGRGDRLRFGGEVMKNVAGYDVSRAYAGSFGTLGLIAEVSLKVLPRPPAEATRVLEQDRAAALATMNQLAARALPLTAAAWYQGRLFLRFAGALPAVAKAAADCGGEALDAGASFWAGLREQTHEFFASGADQALWRLLLPLTADAALPAADALIEWGGAQRWCRGAADDATLREAAAAAGGAALRFRTPAGLSRADSLPLRASALHAIDRRLHKAFDPEAIFSPGRLGGGR